MDGHARPTVCTLHIYNSLHVLLWGQLPCENRKGGSSLDAELPPLARRGAVPGRPQRLSSAIGLPCSAPSFKGELRP